MSKIDLDIYKLRGIVITEQSFDKFISEISEKSIIERSRPILSSIPFMKV